MAPALTASLMPLVRSTPRTGVVYTGGPAFISGPTLYGHSSDRWMAGWPTGTVPLFKYEDTKGPQPTSFAGFMPNHSGTECETWESLPGYYDANGVWQGSESVVRRADQVPVSPQNSWVLAKPSEAVWQSKESAQGFTDNWSEFWQDWRAGRWYIPSRCGQDGQESYFDASEAQSKSKSMQHKVIKGAVQQKKPIFVPNHTQYDPLPCPNPKCEPGQHAENEWCPSWMRALPPGCRGEYYNCSNASEVVFEGASPNCYPVSPCPGETCTRRVYDTQGFGYAEYTFYPDGKIGQKWVGARIPMDVSYLRPLLTPEAQAALDKNPYGQGKWVNDPDNPGAKVWRFEGLTIKPELKTTPDTQDPFPVLPTKAAVVEQSQTSTDFSLPSDCSFLMKADEQGECKLRWGVIGAVAAALWVLTS